MEIYQHRHFCAHPGKKPLHLRVHWITSIHVGLGCLGHSGVSTHVARQASLMDKRDFSLYPAEGLSDIRTIPTKASAG